MTIIKDAVERLEALLGVMNEIQGEDSEYSKDCQLGIDRIKELEESLAFWKKDSRLEQAHSLHCERRIKELEERIKELERTISNYK